MLLLTPHVFAWQIERPCRDEDLHIYDKLRRVENSNTDGYASVGLGVAIDSYLEHLDKYGGADVVLFNVSMTANSRKYITYDWDYWPFWWVDESELCSRNVMTGVGDDWGAWIDIPETDAGYPIIFRFYGGCGSGEYTRVWISSNGFIAFDLSNSTAPIPQRIPNTRSPNAVVAAVWADLNVDAYASIITGKYAYFTKYWFVVIWKNVLHKASGKRLTFEIILEDAPQYFPADTRFHQSDIWISYKSVSAINTDFTFGIEDQEGVKGHGGLCSGDTLESLNGKTLHFGRYASSYFLKKLTLSFYDISTQSRIDIKDSPNRLRGYNIQWDFVSPVEEAPADMFAMALAGTAALLLGGKAGILAAISIAIDTALVTMDWVEAFARLQYSGRKVEIIDCDDDLTQRATASAYTYDYAVDASLSLVVAWILDDPNTAAHSLTITATLEYYEYDVYGNVKNMPPLSTSVKLNIVPDNQLDGQTISEGTYSWLYIDCLYDVEDDYYVNVEARNYISVKMAPAMVDDDFDLYLYDPNGRLRASSKLGAGQTESVTVYADISGKWRIKVDPTDDNGFYHLSVDIYPPAGGCPILYVWNGAEYFEEGLLNIHNPEGNDVVYAHTLVSTPHRVNGAYLFRLVEHPQTISHIDNVRLYAILEDKTLIELPLIWAWHSEHGNVLPQLLFSDDWKVDTYGANWNNGTSQSIDLKFAALNPNMRTIGFIFQIEGNNIIAKM